VFYPHDVGATEQGQMYLVMDLVEGEDLASHKQRYGDAPWMVPILAQVAAGLAAVREKVLTNLLPFAEPPMLIFSREGRLPELVPLGLRCPRLSDKASTLLMRCLDADPAARPGAAEVAAVLEERGLT
jgi:serine/threonine protein kinase